MELLSAADVGALLQISTPGVFRLVQNGKLETTKAGSKSGYHPNDVIKYIMSEDRFDEAEKCLFSNAAKQGKKAIMSVVSSRKFVTPTEAACLLQITRNTLVKWTKDGVIKPERSSPRVNIYDIDEVQRVAVKMGIGGDWMV